MLSGDMRADAFLPVLGEEGVLFGLEELDTFAFSNENDVMWRGFVTSVIAAVSLQWVDPFGTAKLVLFQVSSGSDTCRAFELVRGFLCKCGVGSSAS